MWNKRKALFLQTVLTLLVIMLWYNSTVTAQGGEGVQWSEPVNLSNSPSSSIFPTIATDKYGSTHAFWGEDLEGLPVDPEDPNELSNSIMYSRGDGQTWSQPVDIFFGGYNFPQATIDQDGILHLTFRNLSGIFYSSAPAHQAHNAHAWRPAQFLAPARASETSRIFADQQGGLHLIFTAWENTQYNEKDGNIYYIQSSDRGINWSEPIQLSDVPRGDEIISSGARITIDSQNWLHVVWQDSEPPSYTGSGIQYVRSEDGGLTWSVPFEIARPTGEEEKWGSAPVIEALPSGELHIVWVCGRLPHRCHRRSQDGGLNWSPATRLFGELHSLAGWDTLTVTEDGTLYWVAQLRYPGALYYTWWLGERWAEMQIFHNGHLDNGHYVGLTPSLGNQLNLVVVHQANKEVWYIKGITGASPLKSIPTPTVEPTATPVLKLVTNNVVPTATPRPKPVFLDTPVEGEYSPIYPLYIAVFPVLGVILIVMAVKFLH